MSITRDKKGGNWRGSGGGPPMWLRIMSPISNLASLKTGGKPRTKKRGKMRSEKRR